MAPSTLEDPVIPGVGAMESSCSHSPDDNSPDSKLSSRSSRSSRSNGIAIKGTNATNSSYSETGLCLSVDSAGSNGPVLKVNTAAVSPVVVPRLPDDATDTTVTSTPPKMSGMSFPLGSSVASSSISGRSSFGANDDTVSHSSASSSAHVNPVIYSLPANPETTCAEASRSDISQVQRFNESKEALDQYLDNSREPSISPHRGPRKSSSTFSQNTGDNSFMHSIRSLANGMSRGSRSESGSGSGSGSRNGSVAVESGDEEGQAGDDYATDDGNGEDDTMTVPQTPTPSSPHDTPKTPSESIWTSPFSAKVSSGDDYDHTLYINEKYLDTQYRYASAKRDDSFHKLFANVPKQDRLLDDFSCALSREILLQGRLYISEHYMCFNSNLLGWITNVVISLDEIVRFERRSTAGLFPNGIIVITKEAKHSFASFLSRDSTLNFLETIWSKSVALSKSKNERSRDLDLVQSNFPKGELEESDILSIDGDDDDAEEALSSASEAQYNADSSTSTVAGTNEDGKDMSAVDERYLIQGPVNHTSTTHADEKTDASETVILDTDFDAPLGYVYKVLFSEDSPFEKHVMTMNDALDIEEICAFEEGDDEDILERDFKYQKALNFSIGPKSTTVEASEYLVHCDFNDYVEVVSVSKTPDVPSGNAFDVRTRYIMTWGDNNMTHVIVTYWVNWTGSSWIKGMIERSTDSGQKKYIDDLKCEFLKEIPADRSVYVSTTASSETAEQNDTEGAPLSAVPTENKAVHKDVQTISMASNASTTGSPAATSGKVYHIMVIALGVLLVGELMIVGYLMMANREIKQMLDTQDAILSALQQQHLIQSSSQAGAPRLQGQ